MDDLSICLSHLEARLSILEGKTPRTVFNPVEHVRQRESGGSHRFDYTSVIYHNPCLILEKLLTRDLSTYHMELELEGRTMQLTFNEIYTSYYNMEEPNNHWVFWTYLNNPKYMAIITDINNQCAARSFEQAAIAMCGLLKTAIILLTLYDVFGRNYNVPLKAIRLYHRVPRQISRRFRSLFAQRNYDDYPLIPYFMDQDPCPNQDLLNLYHLSFKYRCSQSPDEKAQISRDIQQIVRVAFAIPADTTTEEWANPDVGCEMNTMAGHESILTVVKNLHTRLAALEEKYVDSPNSLDKSMELSGPYDSMNDEEILQKIEEWENLKLMYERQHNHGMEQTAIRVLRNLHRALMRRGG